MSWRDAATVAPMKRAAIYLQEDLHRALRIKAFEADKSVSDRLHDAVRFPA